jgi:hypothetical protein
MFYSIIGIILIIFWGGTFALSGKRNNEYFLICSGILLLLVMGLRGDFTIDYRNNVGVFNYFSNIDFSNIFKQNNEIIFALIIKTLGLFFNHFQYFHFFLSCLVCLPVLISIKNRSENYLLSVFFFYALTYYFESFNITRNCIAISILIYASQYIKRREITKWMLGILLASGFHASAIVLTPLIILGYLPINKKNIFRLLVFSIIQNRFGFYSHYMDDSYGMWSRTLSLGTSVLLLMRLCIYFTYFLLVASNKKSTDYYVFIAIVSLVTFLISYRIFMIYRFDLYLFSFFVISYPNAFNKSSLSKKGKMIISYLIIVLSIIWVFFSYEGIYYPFWENIYIY